MNSIIIIIMKHGHFMDPEKKTWTICWFDHSKKKSAFFFLSRIVCHFKKKVRKKNRTHTELCRQAVSLKVFWNFKTYGQVLDFFFIFSFIHSFESVNSMVIFFSLERQTKPFFCVQTSINSMTFQWLLNMITIIIAVHSINRW